MLKSITGKRIGIDFDEVLFPMMKPLNKFYHKRYKSPPPSKMPCIYDYSKYYNITKLQSKKLVHDFYYSDIAFQIAPIDESIKTINELSKENELYIITGRQNYMQCKHLTYSLLQTHFCDMFDDVFFTNSYSLVGDEIQKSDICKYLDVDFIIDDSVSICEQCDDNNMENILFGEYEWNKNSKCKRLSSWN